MTKGKKKKPVVCPECKGSGISYLNEKGESDHMNAHTCKSCYGGGIRKEDNEIQAQRVQHIALVIGYNELAKQGQTLGEKVYYRLFRDHHEEQFIKMGGHKMLAREDGICEINVPGHTPHIIFSKDDIELMRKAVAEYDYENGPRCTNCGTHKMEDRGAGWFQCTNCMSNRQPSYKEFKPATDQEKALLAELEAKGMKLACPACKAPKHEPCRDAAGRMCLKRKALANRTAVVNSFGDTVTVSGYDPEAHAWTCRTAGRS